MPIPLIAAAVAPLIQAGIGAWQANKGRKILNNLEQPEYAMPGEIAQSTGLARQAYADERMPGEDLAYGRAALSANTALDAAANSGASGAAVSGIQAAQNAANENISVASQNYQQADMDRYRQQLGLQAQFKDMEWQMNQFAPFMDKYNEGREMVGAGMQNVYGGLDSIGGLATAALSAKAGIDPRTTANMATDRMSQSLNLQSLVDQMNSFQNAPKFTYDKSLRPGLMGTDGQAGNPNLPHLPMNAPFGPY